MRIALLFTFLLWLSSCLATHHSHFARRDHRSHSQPSHDALTSRQHRIRRDLLDVCINANVDLLADASKLLGLGSLLGPLGLASDIELCLCLKDLDLYLDTNVQIQTIIGLLGKNNVAALITALINTSPESQHCTFPPNSHHVCSNSNPCHFECDSPYVLKGGLCVCEAPYMSCNGVCGVFTNGCGSAVPRIAANRGAPAVNLVQAKRTCKPHESVCGIPGRRDTLQFECLDTNSTSTSCGGCVTPHSFFTNEFEREQTGVDCTAIPYVHKVGCVNRQCVVRSCQAGWMRNPAATGCILNPHSSLKLQKVRRGTSSHPGERDLSTCTPSPINPGLQSQLAVLVDLVVDLQGLLLGGAAPSAPPNFTSTTSPGAPIASVLGPNLLPAIIQTTGNILSAPTVSSLVGSVTDLSHLVQTAQGLLSECGCLTNVLALVEQILQSILSIQSFCGSNPVVVSDGNPSAPTEGQLPTISSFVPLNTASPTHLPLEHPTPTQTAVPVGPPPLPPSGSINPEDTPIVVGLTHLLNGLGVTGASSVTVDGLGNGVNVPVNNLLNGLGVGPLDARQDASSMAANVDVNANIKLDLSSLLQDAVGLVNNLLSSLGGGVLATATLDPNLVSDVVGMTGNILSSTSVSSLMDNVDGLVASTAALAHGVHTCGCASGLGSAVDYILALVEAALELQSWCLSTPMTSVPALSSIHLHPQPTVTSPAFTTRAHPVPVVSSTTYHSPTPSPSTADVNPSAPSCTTTIVNGLYDDLPIVVGLDHLFAALGLTGSTGVVTVSGIGPIGGGVNDVLDGVGIGPHGVRRDEEDYRPMVRLLEERQLGLDSTVSVYSELLADVNAIIDLVLSLNAAGGVLPSAPVADLGSLPSSGSQIDTGIVQGVVAAAMQLVSSTTIGQLSNSTDALAATCLEYMQLLESCGCISDMHLESVHDYLVQLVEASLALQNLCNAYSEHPGDAFTTSTAAKPISTTLAPSQGIIVALTKLLNGLGLPVSAVAKVDGLLDGSLDNTVDSLLDSLLGIGPHGVRRHFST